MKLIVVEGRGEYKEWDGCGGRVYMMVCEREERWMCMMKLPLGLRLLNELAGRERGVVGCE